MVSAPSIVPITNLTQLVPLCPLPRRAGHRQTGQWGQSVLVLGTPVYHGEMRRKGDRTKWKGWKSRKKTSRMRCQHSEAKEEFQKWRVGSSSCPALRRDGADVDQKLHEMSSSAWNDRENAQQTDLSGT